MNILPDLAIKNNGPTQTIQFRGCTLLHACRHDALYQNAAITTQHQLVFVREGSMEVRTGTGANQQFILIQTGESVLIRKGTRYHYSKHPGPAGIYDSVLFFVNDAYVRKFMRVVGPKEKVKHESKQAGGPVLAMQAEDLMTSFAQSLLPYFSSNLLQEQTMLEVKTFELMLILADKFPAFQALMADAEQEGKLPLAEVMEQYYLQHGMTLNHLAELSGRSLASFKRDFRATYGATTPAQWLSNRRLEHAYNLLINTQLPIAEIAIQSAFEDSSHFAKVFRLQYGHTPKALRQQETSLALSA